MGHIISVRFGHFLRCCDGTPRVRVPDAGSHHDRHNSGRHGSRNDTHRGARHGTRGKCAHLFLGMKGASNFCTGRVVRLVGHGVGGRHAAVKQVSLVRGFSFFRMTRGRTRSIVGTLGGIGLGNNQGVMMRITNSGGNGGSGNRHEDDTTEGTSFNGGDSESGGGAASGRKEPDHTRHNCVRRHNPGAGSS